MVKGTIDTRVRAVLLYVEGVEEASKICTAIEISRRTLTRWVRAYRDGWIQELGPKKPGPSIRSILFPRSWKSGF